MPDRGEGAGRERHYLCGGDVRPKLGGRERDLGEFPQTGLAVVGQYVRRHGFRVDISESVYGGVLAVVGIPSELIETVDPAEVVPARGSTAPAPTPAADEVPAADEARRGLPRRRSPRHQAAVGASDETGAQQIVAAPAPDPAPAAQPSPEEAGSWMGAFLTATDNSAQQREQ